MRTLFLLQLRNNTHLLGWQCAREAGTPMTGPRCQLHERRGEQPAQHGEPTHPPVCKQCQRWAARSLWCTHLERLEGPAALAPPRSCHSLASPRLCLCSELGRERAVFCFPDPGLMVTHWSRAAQAAFAKSWLIRCSQCFSSLISSC